MAHDAGKVVMGSTKSSYRHADSKKGNIAAGTIVRLASTGAISIAKADGAPLGISLGKDLSDAGFTSICRSGLEVPVLLTDAFNPVAGTQVSIDDVTGLAKAAGTGVTGTAATYASGRLVGIAEDGTEVGVALIDMPGGL